MKIKLTNGKTINVDWWSFGWKAYWATLIPNLIMSVGIMVISFIFGIVIASI